MIDWNKPVRTKDGREVRVLCTDRATPSGYPVMALVKDDYGEEAVQSYTLEGKYYSSGVLDLNDLENVPEVKSLWVNVYTYGAMGHDNRYNADYFSNDDRVALLRLDIQDGTLIHVEIEGPKLVDTVVSKAI